MIYNFGQFREISENRQNCLVQRKIASVSFYGIIPNLNFNKPIEQKGMSWMSSRNQFTVQNVAYALLDNIHLVIISNTNLYNTWAAFIFNLKRLAGHQIFQAILPNYLSRLVGDRSCGREPRETAAANNARYLLDFNTDHPRIWTKMFFTKIVYSQIFKYCFLMVYLLMVIIAVSTH